MSRDSHVSLSYVALSPYAHTMSSPKEESPKWSAMAATDVEPTETEGATLWNHTKTFALVGVSPKTDMRTTLTVD